MVILKASSYSKFNVNIKIFGFGYYSIVPFTFFFLTLEYLYLKSEKQKKATYVELGVILLLNYILYSLTTLRLTYYLVYLVILLYVFLIKFDWIDFHNRIINYLSIMVFPLVFALSIWVNYAFDSTDSVFLTANRLLSNRLYLGHEALHRYSINLFGNNIVTNASKGADYFYIDSGFLFSLLGYGVVFTALMLAIYIYLHSYSVRTNNKMLFIWLTVVAVFSFSNNTWISMQLNPLLLCFPIILKQDNWKVLVFSKKNVHLSEKSVYGTQ